VLAAKGMLTWQVMELIREKQLKDGRWQRTDKGYRLTGTSLATRAPMEEAKSGAFWWWAVGGVVLGGAGLACWRRRKNAASRRNTSPFSAAK
jgi:hypothetical protein